MHAAALVCLSLCACSAPPGRTESPPASPSVNSAASASSVPSATPSSSQRQAQRLPGRAAILRLEPHALPGLTEPGITTLIDLVEGDDPLLAKTCNGLSGDTELRCVSNASLGQNTPIELRSEHVTLTVSVGERAEPLQLLRSRRWSAAAKEGVPGVATDWLIALDVSSSMGPRLDDARTIVEAQLATARPGDRFSLVFFNDREVVFSSPWTKDVAVARAALRDRATPTVSTTRNRSLASILDRVAEGLAKPSAGSSGEAAPLSRVMMVLSSGSGASGSEELKRSLMLQARLTKGEIGPTSPTAPRTPTPLIAVWLPVPAPEEQLANARDGMSRLANPDVGGRFILARKDADFGAMLAKVLRERLNSMWLVEWQAPPCAKPGARQSFMLSFSPDEQILGDGSVRDVELSVAGCKER